MSPRFGSRVLGVEVCCRASSLWPVEDRGSGRRFAMLPTLCVPAMLPS